MKTILHISKYYYPDLGGIETVAKYLAEGMNQYRNVVVCFSTDGHYHEDTVNKISVYRVPVNFSIMSQDIAFSYYSVLKRLVKQYQPDFCHIHCPNPFVYPLACMAVNKRTKIVLHWHSDILSKGIMYNLIKPFETAILKRANMIISTSPNYGPCSLPLQQNIQKVKVAQNGLIESNFEKVEGDEKRIEEIKARYGDKKIVFYCGRHIQYKGIDNLIKADSFIKSDCIIVIGGKGPIDDELKAIPCSDRVVFVGRLSDEELRCHLWAANIFAFPSNTKAEAFGIALAEAMYCECTPVSFAIDGSGVNWVSVNDETGFVVPLNDPKALAEKIDLLCQDEDLCKSLAHNARNRVLENFTSDKAVKAMIDAYAAL